MASSSESSNFEGLPRPHPSDLEKVLLTFNPPWLKRNLTKFEAGSIKSVGGVRSDTRRGKRQDSTNLHVQFKMADFLWPRRHDVKRLFCAPGHDEGMYRISPAYEKLSPMAGVFRKFVGGATEPFSSSHTQYSLHTYEVISVDMCAKVHDLAMMISLLTHKRHNMVFAAPPRPQPSNFGKVDLKF